MSRRTFILYSFFFLKVLHLSGCAQSPIREGVSPIDLMKRVCREGERVREAEGDLRLKIDSHQMTGQYPASARARAEGRLDVEVTNPFGGTEAVIRVRGSTYRVQVPSRKIDDSGTAGYWGGIPFRWIPDLFLGRVPCPDQTTWGQFEGRVVSDREVEIKSDAERFTYRLTEWRDRPWVESVEWIQESEKRKPVKIDFERPEGDTGAPLAWKAVSSEGEIQVRWSGRKVSVH